MPFIGQCVLNTLTLDMNPSANYSLSEHSDRGCWLLLDDYGPWRSVFCLNSRGPLGDHINSHWTIMCISFIESCYDLITRCIFRFRTSNETCKILVCYCAIWDLLPIDCTCVKQNQWGSHMICQAQMTHFWRVNIVHEFTKNMRSESTKKGREEITHQINGDIID